MIRKLIPILGITFIDILGFSMLIPMLPYFVTHFGASSFTVGILFSMFSFCQLIAGPLWGNVSDRIGRKSVLIISQIGATIGWTMLAFSPTIGWVFISRIIEGISGGNIGVTQAYVADLVEPKDRSRAFGHIGATFGAAMIFGPLGGGILYAHYGFKVPFLAAAALQLLTLIVTLILLPESRSKAEGGGVVGFGEIGKTFHIPKLARTLWQKLALSLALYAWFSVFALYLHAQLHFGLAETDYAFSVFAILNVVINAFLISRISDRLGDRGMSNVGLACLLLSFIIVPFVHGYALIAVILALFSFGMALANTGITALISNSATSAQQGTVLGVSSSLDSFAGIVSPPLSTGALGQFGSSYASIPSTIFAIFALVMGMRVGRHEIAERKNAEPAPVR